MWEEYLDEEVEDYMEIYGLLVEDLEVMKVVYRQDNMNCKIIYRQFIDRIFGIVRFISGLQIG